VNTNFVVFFLKKRITSGGGTYSILLEIEIILINDRENHDLLLTAMVTPTATLTESTWLKKRSSSGLYGTS
jgi:hypothetical protein